jgi:hypothetical protein
MNIKTTISHFEQYIDGQVHAISAIRKLVIIDPRIASDAFNISTIDLNTLSKVMPEITKLSALKNSQLFNLTVPSDEILAQASAQKTIAEINFSSSQVKCCISNYCDAQKQCMLSIKSMYDIDIQIAKAIFFLDKSTLAFLDSNNSFAISKLADRHSWFLNLNYSTVQNIFKETSERVSFDSNFVESSLLY